MDYENLREESEEYGKRYKTTLGVAPKRLMEGEGKLELKRLL